ncbi:hypothetical protein B0I21_11171 [Sphingobacterium paludis]|uniref:Uncharacterized protein n=1 Tax=Sphingobacterium paludis TaxID=1476465 RepID=A0A4R7CSV7_9SPHI|nr:hypothetical protein B0I21_11171 [Sphingobacterium paludis]
MLVIPIANHPNKNERTNKHLKSDKHTVKSQSNYCAMHENLFFKKSYFEDITVK